jgi:aromatic ring-opening dioxygenase catalytic subunit (LigB family)
MDILYFSHGGGPLPILGDASHQAMIAFMRALPDQLERPEAVLVISAHWEERVATVLGHRAPTMLYDYYGFPPEAYQIKYPAPGNPDLAEEITALLSNSGIAAHIDGERGFDHGLFIPMAMMYPEADIPMLQLSLIRGLNPAHHIALGRALRSLQSEKILVVGSGFSFHNMRAFSWQGVVEPDPQNDAFQNWLIDVCTGSHSREEREKRLVEWEKAPHARYCHPREEHLLPLHVCLGLSGNPAEVIFDDPILGKRAVAFKW